MKKYHNVKNECKQIITEFELLEEYNKNYNDEILELKEIKYSDFIGDINIINLYFQEINSIPLLSEVEEKRLGEDLKLIKNLSIITEESKENKYKCAMLDLPLVFNSLYDNEYYLVIIDFLLQHFQTNDNIFYKELYQIINKYKNISKNLNRPLNSKELKEYFQIEKIDNISLSKKELLVQIKDYLKYKNAFDKLYCSNLKLVVYIARDYMKNYSLLDLISVGNEALIVAINKFDISLGYKFSTYATWWIWQAIRKFVIEQEFFLKLPFHIKEKLLLLRKNIYLLEQENQQTLSKKEITAKLNLSDVELETYLNYMNNFKTVSLDVPIKSEEGITILEIIEDEKNIEKEVIEEQLKQDIKKLYKNLSKRELKVIKMRFGLDEYEGITYTLKEIGAEFGITYQGVKTIEDKALAKMKRLSKIPKYSSLKDYLN